MALTLVSPGWASGEAGGFSAMYVIGDSLSDAGNLRKEVKDLRPELPFFLDPPYYEGRFADGPVYSDLLAARLGVTLAGSDVVAGGTDFADGGARTDYHRLQDDATKPFPVGLLGLGAGYSFPAEDVYSWTLDGQVDQFSSRHVHDPDALYVVFGAANDLSDLTLVSAVLSFLFPSSDGTTLVSYQAAFIQAAVDGIRAAIEAFADAGGRYILVPNAPNLGVVPGIAEHGAGFAGLATALSKQYNEAFDAMLADVKAHLARDGKYVDIMRFDAYSALTDLVTAVRDTPGGAFGFTNAVEPCMDGFVDAAPTLVCDNPDEYVFFDREHPTSRFHALLVQQMLRTMLSDTLDYLDNIISDLDVAPAIKTGLQKSLANARSALTDARRLNDLAGIGYLKAFIGKVELFERWIPADTENALSDGAQKLIAIVRA
jgi:outer membrane lipase/esterase